MERNAVLQHRLLCALPVTTRQTGIWNAGGSPGFYVTTEMGEGIILQKIAENEKFGI